MTNLVLQAVLGIGALGVTYGRQQAQPLPFPQVVSLMLRNNITAIRFLDPPDAQFLEALAHTGIQVRALTTPVQPFFFVSLPLHAL